MQTSLSLEAQRPCVKLVAFARDPRNALSCDIHRANRVFVYIGAFDIKERRLYPVLKDELDRAHFVPWNAFGPHGA